MQRVNFLVVSENGKSCDFHKAVFLRVHSLVSWPRPDVLEMPLELVLLASQLVHPVLQPLPLVAQFQGFLQLSLLFRAHHLPVLIEGLDGN